jgi:hypothetical protein
LPAAAKNFAKKLLATAVVSLIYHSKFQLQEENKNIFGFLDV